MNEEHTHTQSHSQPRSRCAMCEAGDAMERFMEAFGPSEEVQGHFRQSRVEFLKGVRALLDDRINDMSRPKKGTRVVID